MKIINVMVLAMLLFVAIEIKPATATAGVPRVFVLHDSHVPDDMLKSIKQGLPKNRSKSYQLGDEKNCDIIMNITLVRFDKELYLSITFIDLNRRETSKKAGPIQMAKFDKIYLSFVEPELLKFIKK